MTSWADHQKVGSTHLESEKAENQEWKKRVGYGRRWVVEIFSAFKRIFGESVMARKWDNIVQKVLFKVSAWNRITAKGGWNL